MGATLSVIMPNRDHGRYVASALSAILDQSVPPDEVVVIDDASADHSVATVEAIARRDPRVRLVRNPVSVGPMVAANRALPEVSGTYVLFAAADDRLLPGFAERSLALLRRHPAAGLCSALSRVMDESGRDLGVYRSPIVSRTPAYLSPGQGLRLLRWRGPWFMGNAAIYRRQAVLDAGGLLPELGSLCDGFLQQLLTLRHGACFIPEPLAVWRKSSRGFAADDNADWQRRLDLRLRAAELMRCRYRDAFPEDYAREWERQSRRGAAIAAWRCARAGPTEFLAVTLPSLRGRTTLPDRALAASIRGAGAVQSTLVRIYIFLAFHGIGSWLRGKIERAMAGR